MDGETYECPSKKLRAAFVDSIKEFVAYRRTHGGITLPDRIMIEDELHRALIETEVVKRPPPAERIPLIGKRTESGDQAYDDDEQWVVREPKPPHQ